MKTQELSKQLKLAKKGLTNAHKYLAMAIAYNIPEDESYYFDAVLRYAEMVNDLEIKLKKFTKG